MTWTQLNNSIGMCCMIVLCTRLISNHLGTRQEDEEKKHRVHSTTRKHNITCREGKGASLCAVPSSLTCWAGAGIHTHAWHHQLSSAKETSLQGVSLSCTTTALQLALPASLFPCSFLASNTSLTNLISHSRMHGLEKGGGKKENREEKPNKKEVQSTHISPE